MRLAQHLRSIKWILVGVVLASVVWQGRGTSPQFAVGDDVAPAGKYQDEKSISILAANEFHSQLLEKVVYPIAKHKIPYVEYGGTLRDEGRRSLRIKGGDLGEMLTWNLVGESVVICTLQVSRQETGAIAKCQVTDGVLYVSVTFVDGLAAVTPESLDVKQPEFGGRTIRETVKLLETIPVP